MASHFLGFCFKKYHEIPLNNGRLQKLLWSSLSLRCTGKCGFQGYLYSFKQLVGYINLQRRSSSRTHGTISQTRSGWLTSSGLNTLRVNLSPNTIIFSIMHSPTSYYPSPCFYLSLNVSTVMIYLCILYSLPVDYFKLNEVSECYSSLYCQSLSQNFSTQYSCNRNEQN